MSRDLTLPTRSRGWGKTQVFVNEMARFAAANRRAAFAFDEFRRVWLAWEPPVTLPPVAVKPAFRGRRHGWRR